MTTSPYIHPVPVGATIPAGTKYATVVDRNHDFQQGAGENSLRFTAEPIPAPRPADFAWAEYRKNYEPNPAQLTAAHKAFMAGWAAAASEWPRNTDPLNEDDHRDRISGRGYRLVRRTNGWHCDGCAETCHIEGMTLAEFSQPVTFADEVQS